MTPQETLHSILLDAKARIKNGELYDDDKHKCSGICQFIYWHTTVRNKSFDIQVSINHYAKHLMHEFDPEFDFENTYGKPYDFSEPDRLELLDWLIERTAP